MTKPEIPYFQPAQRHGIPRDEWVARFKCRINTMLGLRGDDFSIAEAELESWPEKDAPPVEGFDPDWMTEQPEAAADENLSNWTE